MGRRRQGLSGLHPLSMRLAEVRREHYGERGRSSFARELGIPVTSYVHYESDRAPPAELLAQAAALTGTNLEWLLNGTGDRHARPAGPASSQVQQVVDEFAHLLMRSPQLIPAAEEFVQLLARMDHRAETPRPSRSRGADHESLIPVVGSTAAGLAHFWHELDQDLGGPVADARLEQLLQEHVAETLKQAGAVTSSVQRVSDPIALVQYAQPDEHGFLEFLSAPELKLRYPTAVAWRIDGESMAPRYRDGDFVITSPEHPAVAMQPCVARQSGQIGVNCKLFQTAGNDVLLIPINEACPTQRFPRESLRWAWRVLASIRLG